jgi:hypothetical protein
MARASFWNGWFFSILVAAFLAWTWVMESTQLRTTIDATLDRSSEKVERGRQEELVDREELQRALDRLDSEHQANLKNPRFRDGSMARAAREFEWRHRLAHDPRLARTAAEQTLVRMANLGRDLSMSAQVALEETARIAAPKGSKIEVTPQGDKYVVKVAYRMAALAGGESGAVTKHPTSASMRAEVREIAARLTRDIFAYCGTRGIASLSLTCNHTTMSSLIPPGATAEETRILRARAKKVYARLYRTVVDEAAARNVADWLAVSEGEVLGLLRVDIDYIDKVNISSELATDRDEADGPLLF